MKFAESSGKRVLAAQGIEAICPLCKEYVVPKCGIQRVHHWAHKNKNCDPWYEPETEWHLNWKANFHDEWVEKTVVKNGQIHRADILTPAGVCLEFQNSPISPEVVIERESFYDKLIWIVNGQGFVKNFEIIDLEPTVIQDTIGLSFRANYHPSSCKPMAALVVKNNERPEISKVLGALEFRSEPDTSEFFRQIRDRNLHDLIQIEDQVINQLCYHLGIHLEKVGMRNAILYWKRIKKVWSFAQAPVFIDIGNELIYLESGEILGDDIYLYGEFECSLVTKKLFLKKYGQ